MNDEHLSVLLLSTKDFEKGYKLFDYLKHIYDTILKLYEKNQSITISGGPLSLLGFNYHLKEGNINLIGEKIQITGEDVTEDCIGWVIEIYKIEGVEIIEIIEYKGVITNIDDDKNIDVDWNISDPDLNGNFKYRIYDPNPKAYGGSGHAMSFKVCKLGDIFKINIIDTGSGKDYFVHWVDNKIIYENISESDLSHQKMFGLGYNNVT